MNNEQFTSERSVETTVKTMFCQLSDSQLTGTFTIGNYAHVERDFLKNRRSYWWLGFSGIQWLKGITQCDQTDNSCDVIRPGTWFAVDVPYSMDIDGNDYSISTTQNNASITCRRNMGFLQTAVTTSALPVELLAVSEIYLLIIFLRSKLKWVGNTKMKVETCYCSGRPAAEPS